METDQAMKAMVASSLELGPKASKLKATLQRGRAAARPPRVLGAGLEGVTAGISAFRRPECVERLVASLRRYYPDMPIIVADNGDRPARLDETDRVTYFVLPFNCGLSAARNRLVKELRTPYLFLLDDDYVATEETRVEAFLDVLHHDPEVGCVGGAMYDSRPERDTLLIEYACDLERFRDRLISRHNAEPNRVTANGTAYRIVDVVLNFGLWRREMLADHRWDERLKVQEHHDYFWSVKLGERWRVAFCPFVRARHDRERPPDDYSAFRNQSEKYFERVRGKWGFDALELPPFDATVPRPAGLPNVVVLGVGHSGTSIVTQCLHALGWRAGDADAEYGESVAVRNVNDAELSGLKWSDGLARGALAELPEPWALKDPRFVHTLDRWLPLLAPYEPLLVHLERDAAAVARSYARRGERVRGGLSVEAAQELAREHFERWPWRKVSLRFEDVVAAAGLMDRRRAGGTWWRRCFDRLCRMRVP